MARMPAAIDPVPALAGSTARPRRAPPVTWVRHNLFGTWGSGLATLGFGAMILWAGWGFLDWAVLHAVWRVPFTGGQPDTAACQAAQGAGACWAVVPEKIRFILFGVYPYAQQWRPALCVALFVALFAASALRRLWRRELALIWIVALGVIFALMWGGFAGLPFVSEDQWGGLPVTLLLATVGLAMAFPIAILTALGRRATGLPAIRMLCVVYVELIRGVPLVSLLFMASVMFPLFLPAGIDIDKLLRAQIAIILFAGAYLAEVVRAGLQSLPKGQYEAADALGLGYWRKTGLIILPQALRLVIPPLVNTFIGFFKDTSLVVVIGLYDLTMTGKLATLEPAWQGASAEVYLLLAVIYFAFCYAMSRASRRLERQAF